MDTGKPPFHKNSLSVSSTTGAGTSRIHEGSTTREATGETVEEGGVEIIWILYHEDFSAEVVAIINMKEGVVEEGAAMTR